MGPLTIKLGILIYHDKSSSKQKLQVCKHQQTALGNKMMFVPITSLLWGPLTMKLGTLRYHDKSSSKQKLQVYKQPQAKILLNGVVLINFL